jgi:hypothetical protein
LKHSNQIHLSQNSPSTVTHFSSFDSHSIQANFIDSKGMIILAEALKSNIPLASLNLTRNVMLLHSFSLTAVNNIGFKVVTKIAEALKSNSYLTSINLSCRTCYFVSCSLNADNSIGTEGAVQLVEALKSNSSLTSLNLSCNILIAFISHSIQLIILIMKEESNY